MLQVLTSWPVLMIVAALLMALALGIEPATGARSYRHHRAGLGRRACGPIGAVAEPGLCTRDGFLATRSKRLQLFDQQGLHL